MNKLLLALSCVALTLSATAQNAPAPAPDAAKLALAREVITAMQADKMFDGMAVQMQRMASQMMPLPADMPAEKRARIDAFQGKVMTLAMDAAKSMVAQMDVIYAELYSEAELQAMKTFFTSAEGRSMLAKQPAAMQRMMPLIQKMQQDLMPKMQQLIEEEKAAEAAAEAAAAAAKPAEPAK